MSKLTPTRKQCSGQAYENTSRRFYPCSNAGKVQHGNLFYCLVHDPDRIAERQRKQSEKWKAEEDASRARYEKERTTKRIGELMQKLASSSFVCELYVYPDGSVSFYELGGKSQKGKIIASGNALLDALEKWDSKQ